MSTSFYIHAPSKAGDMASDFSIETAETANLNLHIEKLLEPPSGLAPEDLYALSPLSFARAAVL